MGKRLLSRKTVELMTADHLAPDVRARSTNPLLAPGYGFGLGFTVRTHTGVAVTGGTVGEYAWGGAFGTYFLIDPKEQLVIVYMTAAPGAVFVHNRLLVKNSRTAVDHRLTRRNPAEKASLEARPAFLHAFWHCYNAVLFVN